MAKPKRIAIALELESDFEHHQDVYRGVLRYASKQKNWHCIIDEYPNQAGGYDGIIARGRPELRERIASLKWPWVNVLHQEHRSGLAGVFADPVLLGALAAEHLIDRGFKRFAAIYDPDQTHPRASIDGGFKRRIVEEELDYFDMPYKIQYDMEHWDALIEDLQEMIRSLPHPAAFFISEPIVSRLFVQTAQEMGLSVPRDLAVICHRNFNTTHNVPTSITAVQSDLVGVGYEAACLLDRMMAGEPVPDEPVMVAPVGLVVRESTDYFAVEDPVVAEALRYISSRLADPLRVGDIAYACNVSTSGLQLKFQATLGRGIGEEVRRLRIALAKRLLREKELTVNEVARRSGLVDGNKMARIFRREVGKSPSAFRKQGVGLGRS
jgi:LacI family transcriptional regulator